MLIMWILKDLAWESERVLVKNFIKERFAVLTCRPSYVGYLKADPQKKIVTVQQIIVEVLLYQCDRNKLYVKNLLICIEKLMKAFKRNSWQYFVFIELFSISSSSGNIPGISKFSTYDRLIWLWIFIIYLQSKTSHYWRWGCLDTRRFFWRSSSN